MATQSLPEAVAAMTAKAQQVLDAAQAIAAQAVKKVDLATPSGGAPMIGIQLPGANAQAASLYDLVARNFNFFGWLTKTQIAAIVAGTFTSAASCSTALHNAFADVEALGGGVITCPAGGYLFDTINAGTGNESTYVMPRTGVSLVGSGDATEFRVANGENARYQWNVFLTSSKLTNCIFRDFKLNGNGANNLLAAGPARSNRVLSATGGGKNVTVENITFVGVPGNSPVAFSGTTDCGNIRVKYCRFWEMGSGIPGNVCIDHTDLYLCGEGNKILYNDFRSTNFITGAPWEFHGDRGEATGNEVKGYSVACWIAPVEQLVFTKTDINHNNFVDIWVGPSFSTVNNAQFGVINISHNIMRMKAGSAAIGVLAFACYGPDKPGAFIDVLNFNHNTCYGLPGENVVGAQPIQTRTVNMAFNHLENFYDGIRLNASGGSLGSGYDYWDIKLESNTIKNASRIPIYYLNSKSKSLTIVGNPCLTDTVQANAIILNGTTDGGTVANNPISPNYTPYPISANNAGLATVNFDQPGVPGTRYVKHNMASLVTGLNKVVYTAGTAAPTTGNGAPGDISIAMAPTVGSPKGYRCTTYGNPGTWVSEGNL